MVGMPRSSRGVPVPATEFGSKFGSGRLWAAISSAYTLITG